MLYLASASPRRRDLLKLAGFRFTVEPAEIDEVISQDDPACLVQNLALKKRELLQNCIRMMSFWQPTPLLRWTTIFLENPRIRNKHKNAAYAVQSSPPSIYRLLHLKAKPL